MSEIIMPVSFTDKAIKEVKNIIAAKKIPSDYGLRVGVNGAGCAGVSYLLGFDKKKEKDLEFEVDGIPIYIEKKSMLYLAGQLVDYFEGGEATGFVFTAEDRPLT